MVKGLEVFREHFRNFADRYVLIGGAACDIAMTGAGLPFRATKDLDIVLYVEALDAAFVRAFWEFVRAGGYEVQEKSTGEKAVLSLPEARERGLSLHAGVVLAATRCIASCRGQPSHAATGGGGYIQSFGYSSR
jgi:hypothetical protein